MACPATSSGQQFLSSLLTQVDCQARELGSYGYGALVDPGSPVNLALTGLLTLMVAIHGLRLMFGHEATVGDLVGRVLRIGIVLTITTSWPAWRVVGYDLVMDGPAEIARAVASGTYPDSSARPSVSERLQAADRALVVLTSLGTGRLPGVDQRDEFRGIALADESGFSWGRIIFLAGAAGSYAGIRLAAGILLALAPLFALFLLFDGPVSIFLGWLRGLAFVALGSVGVTLVQLVNLSLMEPWLNDVLQRRMAGDLAPGTATELVVLSLVFLACNAGVLLVTARILFFRMGFSKTVALRTNVHRESHTSRMAAPSEFRAQTETLSRAHVTSLEVSSVMRRERETNVGRLGRDSSAGALKSGSAAALQFGARDGELLGSSFRKPYNRTSTSASSRDRTP